tara:strand:+ start:396 stop:1676 length:1281 start_codon:yes stop_codon:yes gene_type:complete
MSLPTLTPTSTVSAIVLPQTASFDNLAPSDSAVAAACPIGAYTASADFVTGAIAQVAYTYKKLGGDVLDLEITSGSVYANYEEACLEYSYIVNTYQAKSIIGSALGGTTGSFDHKGEITSGDLVGADVALKYPKFSFESAFKVGEAFATEAVVGGQISIYSASFDTVSDQQVYNLQTIVSSAATDSNSPFYNKVGNRRVKIRQVYYVSPKQMWRFYGYYGGLNVVGDMHTYGQYADDSTFQVIPAWHNKLQAISYEDHLYTRTSHYSYEITNNELKLYPTPTSVSPEKIWFRFTVGSSSDIWEDDFDSGQDGINNMNTLPFENIPYESINAIGKQWIRRFALALSKETLGQVRGKFGGNVPIPGDNISLNASDLLSQAAAEQEKLREELKTILSETTYEKLLENDKNMSDNAKNIIQDVPLKIFVG